MRGINKRESRRSGSALLLALGVTFVLGIGLTSYLLLVRAQNVSVSRSHAWNSALALAEAGIEEAMAHLNPAALLYRTNQNRAANGWVAADGGFRSPRRTFGDGYYDVWMTSDLHPVIYATGIVHTAMYRDPIQRVVRVTTTTERLFTTAMVVRENIDFRGFGIETDSFDSSNPLYSVSGMYSVNRRRDNGDIASTDGFMNIGNAKIMGTVMTGPESSFAVGAAGSVGDIAWVTGGNVGLQPGRHYNDLNVEFPDVEVPFATGLTPQGSKQGKLTYHWILGTGDYVDATPGGSRIPSDSVVLVNGAARLYVPGDFIMVGSSQIRILPGASLELYVGGANTSLARVNNDGGRCAAFRYYGLPGNTQISTSGNGAFLGTIYAPNAVALMGGGGSDIIDLQGAVTLRSVKMNGHYKFHYDEALRTEGPLKAYVVTSWQEL